MSGSHRTRAPKTKEPESVYVLVDRKSVVQSAHFSTEAAFAAALACKSPVRVLCFDADKTKACYECGGTGQVSMECLSCKGDGKSEPIDFTKLLNDCRKGDHSYGHGEYCYWCGHHEP